MESDEYISRRGMRIYACCISLQFKPKYDDKYRNFLFDFYEFFKGIELGTDERSFGLLEIITVALTR